MAVTGYMYDNFPHLLLENGLGGSILSQTIHVALLVNTYTPDQNAHVYFSDVLAHEVAGAGYTHLGAALASKTCVNAAHVTTFDAGNSTWTGTTLADVRYAVIYYNKSGDTDHTASLLIGYIDFGADQDTFAGTFTITWDVAGIFTITTS
jgi:hypothetical protein